MVSGGKDGLYAWMTLCEIYGGDRVIAFNYHKTGIVHELVYQNILNASKILNSELVIVKDDEFLPRFKNNLESFLKNPDSAMVRVALCTGCKYGITGELYETVYSKYKMTKLGQYTRSSCIQRKGGSEYDTAAQKVRKRRLYSCRAGGYAGHSEHSVCHRCTEPSGVYPSVAVPKE